jgi:CheY-like chemotaxis protein
MSIAKKVLVVDDDVSIINLLTDFIPKVLKHEIYLTLTGEEALEILKDKRPDVVLLDMQLPGIDGIQVLKVIRKEYPGTKVLIITSYDKEVKKAVAELGVDGFFPKPIVLDAITNRIEEVLQAKDDTRVSPISLDEVTKKDGIIPVAKILFVEREFWMPYLLPIQDGENEYPPPLIEPYGEYEYISVYCQKEVPSALSAFRPDIVICATDVPIDEPHGRKSEPTAGLIADIMKSKYAPKAIIVHGTQQDINSHGFKGAPQNTGIWVEGEDMFKYDEEKNKENAERLNKMIWSICFKHNLVKKTA